MSDTRDFVRPTTTSTAHTQRFQFNDTNRWNYTATNGSGLGQGDPTTLTWSFVPDGTSIAGGFDEPASPSNLVAFLGTAYGVTTDDSDYTDEPWFPLFDSYLTRWGQLSGLSYVYEPNDDGAVISDASGSFDGQVGVRGDIRISGHSIDGETGSNTLAYNYYPEHGDMVIDTDNVTLFGNMANNSIGLRNVLSHEHGHGLGIDHVCPIFDDADGRLMEPFINLNFDGPQFDDILAAQRSYGDAFEKNGGNDSHSTAVSLGQVSINQTVSRGTSAVNSRVEPEDSDFISIDDNSDVDYFAFTLSSGIGVDVTLTPRGPSYLSGAQNEDGSCSPGTMFHSANQSDLAFQLVDTDGTTILQTANANGIGVAESLSGVSLPAGMYFVRVTGAHNAAQMYELNVTGRRVAGIVVVESDGNTTVDESGTTDTFAVMLDDQPQSEVVLTVTSSDTDEVTVDKSSLTFTNLNWNLPQTVTVSGVDDPTVDGDQTIIITLSVDKANSDNAFDDLQNQLLSVTTRSDDIAGFSVTETSGTTSVSENGTTDTFTIVLDRQPLSDVVISVTSSDAGEVTVDKPSLTFTATNWAMAQLVTARGEQDEITDGAQSSVITLAIDVAQSDDAFDLLANHVVNALTLDDDLFTFASDSILVSTTAPSGSKRVFEFTREGDERQEIYITEGEETSRDVVFANDLHLYNGTFTPVLTSLDVGTSVFEHSSHSGWSTINGETYGGIAAVDNYVFVTDMATPGIGAAKGIIRFDTANDSVVRFANFAYTDLNAGLDGRLYALREDVSTDKVDVFDTDTLTSLDTITLQRGDIRGIAANFNGDIFAALFDDEIVHFDASGAVVKRLEVGTNNLSDINLHPDGTIVVGSQFGEVLLTNMFLVETHSTFSVGTNNTFVAFADETNFAGGAAALSVVLAHVAVDENAGAGATQGLVTRHNVDVSEALAVTLTSSNTSEATVPITVTIPAGSESVAFEVGAVDDKLLDGTQLLTIMAAKQGFQSGSAPLTVRDVETLMVTISADSIVESAGEAAANVTVSRSNIDDLSQALTVSLASDDISEAIAPESVTINANEASTTFTITAIDDALLDGRQTVKFTSSASGYVDSSDTLEVTDHETLTLIMDANAISEKGGSTTATITRSNIDDLSQELTITLASDDTSEATTPASISINANEVSATFTITGVNDALLDGIQTVTITSSASGYTNSSGTVDVIDHETLKLTIAADAISEKGGTTTATISRSNTDDLSQSLTVNLASDDTSEATVPASVTINVDEVSATFSITGVDDALLDGVQTPTVTSSASGYTDSSDTINVTDHETLVLTITGDAVSEDAGTTTASITRSNTGDLSQSLIVNLASDDNSEATVPVSVTIDANEASAVFTITAVDDALLDGTQVVTITSFANGYTDVGDTLDVTDLERLTLTIDADEVNENGGTTTATISRSNIADLSQPLTVGLASDDTSEATVPASVTINANESSATFSIAGVDDALLDGTQTVSITSSATGYADGGDALDVTDHETLTLVLSDSEISEPDGSATLTVTRSNVDIAEPITVSLTSSDETEAIVPVSVELPAGVSSGSVSVIAQSDDEMDGLQTVVLTAIAEGYETSDIQLGVADKPVAWHNVTLPEDVNADGVVSPIDALLIINDINSIGPRQLAAGNGPPFLDSNNDGAVSAIDVLMIINLLNAATGSAEGEAAPPNAAIPMDMDSLANVDFTASPPHLPRGSDQFNGIDFTTSDPPHQPSVPLGSGSAERGEQLTSTTNPSKQVSREALLEESLDEFAEEVAEIWTSLGAD